MGANKIEIYQNNNKTINCVVSGLAITGYTPYLSVKKKAIDASTVLSKTGVITDASTATFYLTPTDTSLASLDYVYDITIENDSSIYTVVKDTFTILEGVKY